MARVRRRLSPAQLFTASVVGLILLGTVLLALPFSSRGHQRLALVDAAFTSTSAVCVTGLVVVDTPRDLSLVGQLVLMALIQLGGLGYMTLTTVVAVAIGRQLTVQERLTLHEALNTETLEGVGRFALSVLKLTLAFELAGATLLAARWLPQFGAVRASYYGLFHAVSAFNNAGFALFSDNLIGFRGDWLVNLVICGLIVCGGLGFVVLTELGHVRGRRLSVHTRLVLALTALLIAGGTAALLVLERHNPGTLGPLPFHERFLAALFQSVSPRTAGFNTIDIGAMVPASLFLLMILMFIGASPGGTGGGVKTTTFGITVAALLATVRGRTDTTIMRRRVPQELVARSFFISLIAFLALNTIAALLLVVEGRELLPTLFETTSAFGTVGLSMGEHGGPLSLAGHFTAAGKLLLMAMMLAGRVGPLTLAFALAGRRTPPRVRYPEGRVLIG